MRLGASSLLLVVAGCSFVLVAHAHPHWGWWWRHWRCDTDITVTITSSECSRPLEGVYIRSNSWYSRVISSSDGVYTLRVCSLPVSIYMWKRGYRYRRMVARHTEETVTLECIGTACEGTTTSEVSISSTCGQPIQGVTFDSQEIMSVTSPSPGMYNLKVCSLPLEVTYEAEGYDSLTSTITATSAAIQMSCIGPDCGMSEITLTVKSSDCNTPVADVTITSSDVMTITETEPGTYICEVCGMPVTLSLEKEGFDSMTTTVSGASEIVTLICSDPMCTAQTVTATVTSECGTLLDGVQLTSAGVLGVETNSPGVYELSVCSLPQGVTAEKVGYDTVTQNIASETEAIQMTCNSVNCGHLQRTITVRSSDCQQLVDGVSITSSSDNFLLVTSTTTGQYSIEVCSLSTNFNIELDKDGFISATIATDTSDVELQCDGPACTAQTVSVSVTADCTSTPVIGVAIGGQDVVHVSSSAPGSYQIAVCSDPTTLTLVRFDRIGYASQQTTVRDGSTVMLECIEPPVIVEDPQSKYRRETENVKLCCQADTSTGVTYKWYKDGAERTETSNELMLTSLGSNDEGLYQCSAKLTADPNLPAVRSEEAMLTIRAASDGCGDAWRPMKKEVFPDCYVDVGECLKRPCRSGSAETCSDNNVCCENTQTVYPDCAGNREVTIVVGCSCTCTAPTVVIVRGTVEDSESDLPLADITVTLVGDAAVATTDANGEFSFNTVPATRRRIVIKASESSGTYLDNYVVQTIPSQSFAPVNINIPMIKKAPFIEINPAMENTLSVSGDPSEPNTGSAYLNVPADAFFNTNGTHYTGSVFVSLTYLNPSERLEDAPGEFVTLNPEGLPELLVTLGVFVIEFEDGSGNQLLLNDNIEVYAYGSTPYLLWQLDEQTGTWILINTLPGRKKRQDTQGQLIGSFTPQNGRWYNIDYVYNEPDCFFKIRVFQNDFSEGNEVTTSLTVIPKVRQILASNGTNVTNGVKYWHGESMTGCFRIKCPDEIATAKISAIAYESILGVSSVEVPLMPATIDDYSTAVKGILQPSPYNYSLFADDTSKIFVNTKRAMAGPFYESMDSCEASTFDEPALWFAKPPEFVEGDFYGGSEERCVGKIRINIWSVTDPDAASNITDAAEINALSIWSDNKYGSKVASIHRVAENESEYASCFEYRCSIEKAMTSVFIDFPNNITAQYECYFYGGKRGDVRQKRAASLGSRLYPPVLNASEMPAGYFFSGMSNVQEAIDRCKENAGNYAGFMDCYPNFEGSGRGSTNGQPGF